MGAPFRVLASPVAIAFRTWKRISSMERSKSMPDRAYNYLKQACRRSECSIFLQLKTGYKPTMPSFTV